MTAVQTREVARSLGIAEDSAVAAQYAQIFSLLDRDNDGWISKTDLMVGLNLPARSVDHMISIVGGGERVDVLSFVKVMSNPAADLGEEQRRQSIVTLTQSTDDKPANRRDSTAMLVAKLDQMDKMMLDPLLEIAPPDNLRDSADWKLQSSTPQAPERKAILSKGSNSMTPPAPPPMAETKKAITPPRQQAKRRRFKGLAHKVSQPRIVQSLLPGKRQQPQQPQPQQSSPLMNPYQPNAEVKGSSVADLSKPVNATPIMKGDSCRDSSVMLLEKVYQMEKRHENGGSFRNLQNANPRQQNDENSGAVNNQLRPNKNSNNNGLEASQKADKGERISRIPAPSSFIRRR